MASAVMVVVSPPKQRLSLGEVNRQHQLFADNQVLRDVMNAVPTASTVLNMRRQIVFSNRAAQELAGVTTEQAILGLRPGDALHCIHADRAIDGCGTTEFCSTCGAAQAICTGEAGHANAKECRMTRNGAGTQKESAELMVSVTPITVSGESFLTCSMTDVSHERRRRALERTFFHDLLNSVSGVILSTDLIDTTSPPEVIAESANLIRACSLRMVAEIQSHENLMSAESGDLKVRLSEFSTLDMTTLFFEQYQHQFLQRGITLSIAEDTTDLSIRSDQALLGRVLGNMLKNAMEASTPGSNVRMGSRAVENDFEIWVQNQQLMPLNVQRQVFQRSFSTKATDRGLGTYSMRLLSERFLQGTVRFTSNKISGTTFVGRYPVDPSDNF